MRIESIMTIEPIDVRGAHMWLWFQGLISLLPYNTGAMVVPVIIFSLLCSHLTLIEGHISFPAMAGSIPALSRDKLSLNKCGNYPSNGF